MQLQPISNSFPNTVSITQVRQDIDVLTKMLDKHGEVNVLKGQKVFFKAIDPDFEAKKQVRIRKAAAEIRAFAKEMAKKYPRKSGEKTLSEWVIEERDRMRDPKNYD